MPLPAFLIPAAIAGGTAVGKWWAGRQAAKKIGARSPEEKAWLAAMRKRSEEGAIDVQGRTQDVTRVGQQVGATQQQQSRGRLIKAGLEDSIVADDIRRRTDADTLRTIANEARQIALANEQSKLVAQDQLGAYGRDRSELMRRIALMELENTQGLIGGLGGAAGSAYSEYRGLPGSAQGASGSYAGTIVGNEYVLPDGTRIPLPQ